MNTAFIILMIIMGLTGIAGCVLPILPGPFLSWLALLLTYFFAKGTDSSGNSMSLTLLLVFLGLTILVTLVDYILTPFFVKLAGGSKYASWGAVAGLLVGLLIAPIGIIVGPIIGAFIAEKFFSKKDFNTSLKSSLGAFGGFILGSGLKVILCGLMFYFMIVYLF